MKKDYEVVGDGLLAGQKELVTSELVLSTGKVTRGDIVDSTGVIITATTEVFGVVCRDADATGGAVKTTVYVEGEFNIENVNFGTLDKEKATKLCAVKNIYLRPEGGKK